jgi:hypothetical protein
MPEVILNRKSLTRFEYIFTVPVKTGRRDKTDMLLEVALNTHKTNTNLMSLECISLFKYFDLVWTVRFWINLHQVLNAKVI